MSMRKEAQQEEAIKRTHGEFKRDCCSGGVHQVILND